jgi:hypothetical protein
MSGRIIQALHINKSNSFNVQCLIQHSFNVQWSFLLKGIDSFNVQYQFGFDSQPRFKTFGNIAFRFPLTAIPKDLLRY